MIGDWTKARLGRGKATVCTDCDRLLKGGNVYFWRLMDYTALNGKEVKRVDLACPKCHAIRLAAHQRGEP